ncbi:hypothetical protein CBL_10140 [Carabus blaptoides fortunei]
MKRLNIKEITSNTRPKAPSEFVQTNTKLNANSEIVQRYNINGRAQIISLKKQTTVKEIPVAVEKEVPYHYEKLVPFHVEVPRPYPVHVPVYKHIYLDSKPKEMQKYQLIKRVTH